MTVGPLLRAHPKSNLLTPFTESKGRSNQNRIFYLDIGEKKFIMKKFIVYYVY